MPLGRSNRRAMIAGAAISSSRSKKRAAAAPAPQAAAAPAAAPSVPVANNDMFAQLEKLGALRDKGILTDAEFDAKKKQILGL